MDNQQAYDQWASSYNEIVNLTRDAELIAKKEILKTLHFSKVLELGCGTGKNTQWLLEAAENITAVDFSAKMLVKASERIKSEKVNFIQADINKQWSFLQHTVDLITCSLVLEHIEHLQPVFEKAGMALHAGGYFYIGELHPFKQYAGSKARFEHKAETIVLDCYTHPISEFISLAMANNFSLVHIHEWPDEDGQNEIPRILTLLFKKNDPNV
ncbi:MAG TPA: class I SAM-dependent methyltransferase [Ferruginibacter sp.]|nr:class I SAM-dependent methyltransferase [Ferruginibacter sp.]